MKTITTRRSLAAWSKRRDETEDERIIREAIDIPVVVTIEHDTPEQGLMRIEVALSGYAEVIVPPADMTKYWRTNTAQQCRYGLKKYLKRLTLGDE
jgi:hypothetical protein